MIYDIDMYVLTPFGLTPGGSSAVRIYTQTIHRTTQLATRRTQFTTEQHNYNKKHNLQQQEDCDVCFEINNTSFYPQPCVVRLVLTTSDDIYQNRINRLSSVKDVRCFHYSHKLCHINNLNF